MTGYIHSIETFATLDGGGIRFAVFLQGCPLRCVYCHNPDSQSFLKSNPISTTELVAKIARRKNYYKNGGVTVSGGEPLAQNEFLEELLRTIKSETALETAVDTSFAIIPNNFNHIIDFTDLFIVDLKFWDNESYLRYTNGNFLTVIETINCVATAGKRILLRTVIVPGINDTTEILDKYLEIAKSITTLERYELLGFHTLGAYKYAAAGVPNPLEGVLPMDKTKLDQLQHYVEKRLL